MHFHRSPSRPQSGFALLVTITLVAFLVLLLVSFASLTRVETQVAGNSRQLASSQENALMALNLAIGQLQKYAGPDQRVTAPSDAGTTAVSPNRSDSRPHWTGVWRNTTPTADTASRELLTWLVSGNEDAATPLKVNPPDAIADPDTDSNAVWLVHDGAALQAGGAGVPEQYVKLAKQDIKAGSVPGLADVSGGHTVGRYAWWVGDEGVKARVNMVDPHASSSMPAERGLSFATSQGAAVGLMDRGTSTTLLGTAYPAPADTLYGKLDQIDVPAQLTYASNEPAVMTTAAKAHFHDMTTASFGVLADVAQGGLKKDLSAGLAAGATTPADNDPIFPVKTGDGSYDVPRWSLLRSYANTQVAPGAALTPQPIAPRTIGTDRPLGSGPATFSPVVTYAGVGVDYLLGPGASLAIDVHLFPCVVLWNPYSVPLAAKDYTIIFYPRIEDAYLVELTRETDTPSYKHGSGYGSSGPSQFALDRPFRHLGNNAPLHCRFKIACPVIPAGQSLIFTLPASLRGAQAAYQPGLNELVPGLNPDVSVVIPTNITATAESEKFKLFAYDSTREEGFVLCDFDSTGTYNPAGSSPYESAPPLNTPRWYQTVQRMNPVLRNNNYVTPEQPLAHAPPSGPSFVWDMYAGFSASTHFDSQWIAHDNPRAPVSTRARSDGQGEGTVTGGNTDYAFRSRKVSPIGWPGFNYDATIARASAGQSLDVGTGAPTDVVLFEQPSPTFGLLSIGQLQQAPLSRVGFYPAYPVGNSLAPIRLSGDVASSNAGTSTFNVTKLLTTHYDLSWKLNRALWDRYFFSTVPSGAAPGPTLMNNGTGDVVRPALTQADIDAGVPLPNSRMHYYADGDSLPPLKHLLKTSAADSDPYNQAAANLLVTGAFNINSTSEQAWRAVLAGTFGINYEPESRVAGTTTLKAAFPRFTAPTSDNTLSDTWQGYRQLDESQIAQLAANIVAQVKARGPFLSLADFVNRNLALDQTGLKGALQAALDATTTGAGAANDSAQSPFNQNLVTTAPSSSFGTFYFDHMRNDTAAATVAHESRNAFAPKFLTQGDILAALGPALTARSDTFKIRAYGETVNPLLAPTDPNYITSRSWCEAIVQRMPEYIDPAVNANAWDLPASGSDGEKFGRRFKVVSFRWLTDSDL